MFLTLLSTDQWLFLSLSWIPQNLSESTSALIVFYKRSGQVNVSYGTFKWRDSFKIFYFSKSIANGPWLTSIWSHWSWCNLQWWNRPRSRLRLLGSSSSSCSSRQWQETWAPIEFASSCEVEALASVGLDHIRAFWWTKCYD